MIRSVIILCTAEIFSMVGYGAVPALLPTLIAEWQLTNTGAGVLTGAYFVGYMVSVPVLVSLTDRISAQRIYLFSIGLTMAGMAGFVFLTGGLWTGVLFHTLCGAGLAGTYMPGLRLLSDLTEGPRQPRFISFYTATFSAGAAVSYFLSGLIGGAFGWTWAFVAGVAGAAIAGLLVLTAVRPAEGMSAPRPATALLDFRPVLRERAPMGYILGYTAHMIELFAVRSWIVAFLVWVAARSADGSPLSQVLTASTVAGLVALVGMPASVFGNEMAMRYDRRRVVTVIMLISAAMAPLVGLSGALLPYGVVVALFVFYATFVMGDSASLTAGSIGNAPEGYRGATMALHSSLGFCGGFVGSVLPGLVLDVTGGMSLIGWTAAFAVVGLTVAMGPLALTLCKPRTGAVQATGSGTGHA